MQKIDHYNYVTFQKTFYSLLLQEIKKLEQLDVNVELDMLALAHNLPRIVSLVNSLGLIRGQDNYFVDFREISNTYFQKEMYINEQEMEERLNKLIDKVLQSKASERYKIEMYKYFTEFRKAKLSKEQFAYINENSFIQ
jgi:hypothetical protein